MCVLHCPNYQGLGNEPTKEARDSGIRPVLVTSVARRTFHADRPKLTADLLRRGRLEVPGIELRRARR